MDVAGGEGGGGEPCLEAMATFGDKMYRGGRAWQGISCARHLVTVAGTVAAVTAAGGSSGGHHGPQG